MAANPEVLSRTDLHELYFEKGVCMTAFHVSTAYLIAGLLYLVMPMAVWLLLRSKRTTSVALWCSGSEILGFSLVCFSLRGALPDWMTYSLANLLFFVGALMRVQSLRVELGSSLQPIKLGLAALLCLAGYEFFRAVLGRVDLHFVWSTTLIALLFAWQSRLSWQIAHRDRSQGAWWLSVIYVPVTVALLARAALVLWQDVTPGPLHANVLSMGMILLSILSAVIGHLGFLGLHVERSIRNEMEVVAAKAKLEEDLILGQQIAQLDRVKSVGQIAASLAHELSQPLTNITLLSQCAQSEMAQTNVRSSALSEYLKDIEKNTNLTLEILHRIRQFIKAKEIEYTKTSLKLIATDVADLLRDWMLSERIQLNFHFPAQEIWVLGDSVQLSQILMNVYRNAIQATSDQLHRKIEVNIVTDGQHAKLTVVDNGQGLPPETLEKISTPFFTTKVDGLGVGLTISKSIAEQHGGSLSIANGPTAGAVVTLTLPVVY